MGSSRQSIDLPPACISGVGSLPFEAWPIAEAKVIEWCPELPFVPELPRLGKFSSMLLQPFSGLERFFDAQASVHKPTIIKGELEAFIERLSEMMTLASDKFNERANMIIGKSISAKALKSQGVGPFTLFRCLGYGGRTLEHIEEAWHGIAEFLAMRIRHEAELAKAAGLGFIYIFDEPLLGATVLREAGRTGLICRYYDYLMKFLRDVPVEFGIHCCSAFPVERAVELQDVFHLRWLSAPLKQLTDDSWLKFLSLHFEQGGRLMPGVLATHPGSVLSNDDETVLKLEALSASLELAPKELLQKIVLTPDCGLGLLDAERASRTFETLQAASRKLRSKYVTQ